MTHLLLATQNRGSSSGQSKCHEDKCESCRHSRTCFCHKCRSRHQAGCSTVSSQGSLNRAVRGKHTLWSVHCTPMFPANMVVVSSIT